MSSMLSKYIITKKTEISKVHFIGIGGIGVSALAGYFSKKGIKITGSDLVQSETIEVLKRAGARVFIGKHSARNLPKDVDLIIYSPAVQPNNPEVKKAKKLGIKVQSYPEALGELTKKYFTIAVSGTHGKSTTVSMVALILIKAGFDPTVIVGTKLKQFKGNNFRMGKSKYLVIEADEWQASFLDYWPEIIVLTNIEAEHLDYYRNLGHILKTYRKYISHLSREGVLVMNGDDKNILKVKSQISNVKCQKFSLKQKETKRLKKILRIPGNYNVYNALAALVVARSLKIPDRVSFKALSKYKGAWRRFETIKNVPIGKKRKIIIISDYAHHPTEIKATLEAAREKFSNRKIWCVFQPHQHQRTFYLFKNFVKTFVKAPVDKLIITDIYDVAGREKKGLKKRISPKTLIREINKDWAVYLPKGRIKNYLRKNLKGRETVIIMGAGDIYKLIDEL
jgi:UDP-N-acetylmuramate--alanine ligase